MDRQKHVGRIESVSILWYTLLYRARSGAAANIVNSFSLTRAMKGAEGICEYLLARPQLMEQMAGVDMDIEQRLASGKDMAKSYRALLKADTAEEALSAARKLKEAASVPLNE